MKRENDPAADATFATGAKRETLDPTVKPAMELISPLFMRWFAKITAPEVRAVLKRLRKRTRSETLLAFWAAVSLSAGTTPPETRLLMWTLLARAWDVLAYGGRPGVLGADLLADLGTWCGLGALKYAPRNWEKGIPLSRSLGACLRHVEKVRLGACDENHRAAVTWNLMALVHTQEVALCSADATLRGLDDLPNYALEYKASWT